MRLDNRKHFGGESSHARRLLRSSNGSFRILLHASAFHSTQSGLRRSTETQMNETPNPLSGFCVRRTPRACHGGCDHLRPGSLRASHAVCLAARTLEPAICARKEGADIESVSTIGRFFEESLVLRGDFFDTQTVPFGFYAMSRYCIPRLSPRNSNSAKRLTMALQRTAPRVTVAAILI